MKFISKYRRYSIKINGRKYSFMPEEATGVYSTEDESEIKDLKGSVAYGRDYHASGEDPGRKKK